MRNTLLSLFVVSPILAVPPPGADNGIPDSDGEKTYLEQTANAVVFTRGDGQPILEFHFGKHPAPTGEDPQLARSGFVHPLYSPRGHRLTRIQPPDHWHHYGIWNPWTRVQFEGRTYDCWNLDDGTGTVRFHHSAAMDSSSPLRYGSILHHVIFPSSEEEIIALSEAQMWTLTSIDDDHHTFDLEIELTNPNQSAVVLERYRYGGLSWRPPESWTSPNSEIITSSGESHNTADGTRAEWILTNGRFENPEENCSVLILSHPDNFNHPQPLRVWPEDQHEGAIFINFCPIKNQSWTILPGETVTLRYRWLVTSNHLFPENAQAYFEQYAEEFSKVQRDADSARAAEE